MPYVSIETVKGMLDDDQKKQLLERITDLMVEIEGRGNPEFRKVVWVRIDEQAPAHWSLGGMIPNADRIARAQGSVGSDGRHIAAKA